jgi:hypothetical protein
MKLIVASSALAILIGSGFGAAAQPATPAQSDPPESSAAAPAHPAVQKISRPYFIEFRARSAMSYGHTFVVIGRSGQRLTKANVVGLHPFTESSIPWMVGHLIVVPAETGWSDGDIEDRYIIARYRIALSEPEYKRLTTYVATLKATSPLWHAVLYNCNAFVGDIASHMGLQIPSSSLVLPKEYITELKNLNAVRRVAGRTTAAHGN